MSNDEDPGTEISPRRSRRPQTRERNSPTEHSSGTLADAISQRAVCSSSVETDTVAATLVGIPEIELEEFVYAHQLDRSHSAETRPVALFDLENRSDRPVRWRSTHTKFIGDDGYTYRPAHLSLEPSQLGPGCHTRQVEIEPGHRARMVTMVERLPQDVAVVEVVQTITRRGGTANDRLVFSIE